MTDIIIPGQTRPSNNNRIARLERDLAASSSLLMSMGKLLAAFESRIDDLEDLINKQTKEKENDKKTD